MCVIRMRLISSTRTFIAASFWFKTCRDSSVCRPVSISVYASPSRNRKTFTCFSSNGMGNSNLKMPGATSIACTHYLLRRASSGKLRGGLDGLVGAVGHQLLALIFGWQGQVHGVGCDQVQECVDD